MSYKDDLETNIRESYRLINEYEEIIRFSDIPKEKVRAQRTIDEQWKLINGYASEYKPLCKRLRLDIATDLLEILSHFSDYNKGQRSIEKISHTTKACEIFFSYAHKDERLRNELAKQLSYLKREGLIDEWHDRLISPGKEWVNEINLHLNTAHIILLLVSADYVASDYCYSYEMRRALERQETGEARVIPVILRPVEWKDMPFSKLQALPKNGKPVTTWANIDQALLDVAQGIRRAVKELRG